jgi:hypothetical protein
MLIRPLCADFSFVGPDQQIFLFPIARLVTRRLETGSKLAFPLLVMRKGRVSILDKLGHRWGKLRCPLGYWRSPVLQCHMCRCVGPSCLISQETENALGPPFEIFSENFFPGGLPHLHPPW